MKKHLFVFNMITILFLMVECNSDEPTANFDFSNGDCSAPCEVYFNNLSTNADSYVWRFGDGNTSTEENPMHTYATGGTYNVVLTASNSDNKSDISTQLVNIINGVPTADFSFSGGNCTAPCQVAFTNYSANAVTYFWEFGDGSTSTEVNPTHTYSSEGIYNVSLTARDIENNSDQTTRHVQIKGDAGSNDKLISIKIKDWGGEDIGSGRQTPYDGDGNAGEFFAIAEITIDGTLSSWTWCYCKSECYDDTKSVNHSQGWNQFHEQLKGVIFWQGYSDKNTPSIHVEFRLFENDDSWPEELFPDSDEGFSLSDVPYGQIVSAGVGIATAVGLSIPYASIIPATVNILVQAIKFFWSENPDDILWQFESNFNESGTEKQTFTVPGHSNSKHWLQIEVLIQ